MQTADETMCDNNKKNYRCFHTDPKTIVKGTKTMMTAMATLRRAIDQNFNDASEADVASRS